MSSFGSYLPLCPYILWEHSPSPLQIQIILYTESVFHPFALEIFRLFSCINCVCYSAKWPSNISYKWVFGSTSPGTCYILFWLFQDSNPGSGLRDMLFVCVCVCVNGKNQEVCWNYIMTFKVFPHIINKAKQKNTLSLCGCSTSEMSVDGNG